MESTAAGSAVGGALRGRLPASVLRTECAPDDLGFATTAELEPLAGLLGQERALRSIRFGTAIRQPGYNLFALGPSESGRHSAILSFLEERARSEETPSDWVYVNNFDDPASPSPCVCRKVAPSSCATA
jgi:hypothetical protein